MKSVLSECAVPLDETIGCNRPIFINTIIFHKTHFINAALVNRKWTADKFFFFPWLYVEQKIRSFGRLKLIKNNFFRMIFRTIKRKRNFLSKFKCIYIRRVNTFEENVIYRISKKFSKYRKLRKWREKCVFQWDFFFLWTKRRKNCA